MRSLQLNLLGKVFLEETTLSCLKKLSSKGIQDRRNLSMGLDGRVKPQMRKSKVL